MTLREYLTREGISPRQMAQSLDCSEAVVYGWMSGRRLPSLVLMARIEEATGGSVLLCDFVPEVEVEPLPEPKRRGRPTPRPSVEEWTRRHGLKAVGLLLAQIPGGPPRSRILRYLEDDPRPRWRLHAGGGNPSIWTAETALDVSDSYRIVQALRGRPPVLAVEVERVDD